MTGTFRDSQSGDSYQFRRNGSYTFTSGRSGRATGNLSHSGTWKLLSSWEGEGHAEGGTVQLKATRRVVLRGGRQRVLRASRTFRLAMKFPFENGVIGIDSVWFYAPDYKPNS